MPKTQSFANHTQLVPLYHGFVLPALGVNFLWAIYRLFSTPSIDAGIALLTAVALVGLALAARVAALSVQDRVIRLEMRLRLRDRLPADLRDRIGEFTIGQLVALRFASDDELPALAAQVLRDNIKDKATIKKMIQRWEADHHRA